MRQYRWRRQDDWSRNVDLERLMETAKTKVVTGTGPFSLIENGDQIGGNKTRSELLSRFQGAISNREPGSTFRVRNKDGNVVLTARAVEALSDADSTNGNAHADKFWNWVRLEYRAFEPRYAGAYVCKTVSGSSTLSQHSYGNAVDVFFDTLAHQHDVYTAIKNGKCPVPMNLAICERHDWSPSAGETPYGGDFHGHLHAQFQPTFTGTCGVRL